MSAHAAATSTTISAEPQQQPQEYRGTPVTYYQTEPDEEIVIGMDHRVKDNKPTNTRFTLRGFFDLLQRPDRSILTKDGPGFMNGPCNGLRRKANVPYYHFAVLDGDASLDEKGNKVDGAPSPVAIHKLLTEYNLSHCIYTTYSHAFKGARWRLLIPSRIASPAHLRGLLTYLVEVLRAHAHLPVYLTPESTTWGNRWHLPRTSCDEAPFYAAYHFGYSLEAEPLARYYGQLDLAGQEVRESIPPIKESAGSSLLEQFCALHPLPDMLTVNGYTFHGQSVVADQFGIERPVLRFKKPDSDSEAGVVVYWEGDRWRGYSHHRSDPLNTGHSFDSFDVFRLIGGTGDGETDWYLLAAEMVREKLHEYMTENHPIVLDGSRFRVGYKLDSPSGPGVEYRLMRWEDFSMKMDQKPGIFVPVRQKDGTTGLKLTGLAEWWRKNPDRFDHDGVIFKPTRIGERYQRTITINNSRFFNLFNGWHIKPAEGSCELIEWHIRHALCSNNDVEVDYFMDWLAHIFQFPEEKPNVALVLRGGKGIGKSIIMSRLAYAFGSMGTVIANSRQLTGEFNAHLRHRLLAVVEESFWAGSHQEEGVLKHLISDELTTYERKGVDPEAGRSFIRIVLVTNNEWAAPASSDERRFFVPTASQAARERQKEEGDYFERLVKELDGGGIDALVHKLLRRRISKTAVRYPPRTKGLERQKLLSLTGLRAWLYDTLKAGYFRVPKSEIRHVLQSYPRRNLIPMETLEESAVGYTHRFENGRSLPTRIELLLNELFGDVKLLFSGGKLLVDLASLHELRVKFAAYMEVDIDWGETYDSQ